MRDIPTSPRIAEIKRKRRAYIMRLTGLFFLLFVSLVVALSYFSSHQKVIIRNVSISGTHIINPVDIEESVREQLSGKYIHLFSRANMLIYPREKIYDDLLVTFPRIEKLAVTRDNWHTISIQIEERSGSYLYCGSSLPEAVSDIGENCYFMNNDGYIFDTAPYFSGNVYFKYYSPLPDGVSEPLGSQMLQPDEFHRLARFIDHISILGFKPTYLIVNPNSVDALALDNGDRIVVPKIIFESTADLENMLDNLKVAMNKKEFADEIWSKYSTLLYIDLRFKNKVLYKFQ